MIVVGETGSRRVYTAKTLAEYIRRLENIKVTNRLLFRGLSNTSYELLPSIVRGEYPFDKYDKSTYLKKESRFVEFSQQRFPDSFSKATPSLLLANMQHFGIPTRMMDVTGNALVALFFACRHEDCDGEVIIFDKPVLSAYDPFANIIADTYRLINNNKTSVEEFRYKAFKQSYSSSLLYPDWEKEQDYSSFIVSLQHPIVVDVGMVNQRQINQDGKFIIFPNRIKDGEVVNELIGIDKTTNNVEASIYIPKNCKKKINEQLKIVSITVDFLFPEIETICKEIKRQIFEEE